MPAIEGAQRPFWMHQVVEYLIGIILIAGALQSPEPTVPAVMGVLVVGNTSIARGPASAFPLVGRKMHRWLDVAVMVTLLIAAFQPIVSVDGTGRALLCGVTVILFFIWLNSDFTEKVERKGRLKGLKRERRERLARPQSEEIGKKAGRMFGSGVKAARRYKDKLSNDSEP